MTDEINTMYDNKEINTKVNYVIDSCSTNIRNPKKEIEESFVNNNDLQFVDEYLQDN